MSNTWGYAIPGLAMAAIELPDVAGLMRADNPDIGNGPQWGELNYSLKDLAEEHAKKISSLNMKELTIIGMSMGGMITSILASDFRHLLPPKTAFRILVSSPNFQSNPAITPKLLANWKTATPGVLRDFQRILEPFFSKSYLNNNGNKASDYFQYRAFGKNNQSAKSLYRQIGAILKYNGVHHLSKIDPSEVIIIGGLEDYILGPSHNADFKKALNGADNYEIPNLGHMVNIEMPWLFSKELAL